MKDEPGSPPKPSPIFGLLAGLAAAVAALSFLLSEPFYPDIDAPARPTASVAGLDAGRTN